MLRRVASEVRGDYGIIAAVRSDSQSVGSAFREMLSALDELQHSNDERLALIIACEIASSHETEVVQRLESRLDRGPAELEFRTLPRGELAESIKQRRELVAKFDELREKLRCVNIDARPDNSPKSPMPSIGPGAESSVQANLDPLPETPRGRGQVAGEL